MSDSSITWIDYAVSDGSCTHQL